MRTSEMLRSAFRLASAIILLILASTKQFPLAEVLKEPGWSCDAGIFMSVFRALIWVFSDQGRAAIAAVIAGMATLSFLRTHPLVEAREFGVGVLALLAFLFFTAMQAGTGSGPKACAHLSASLTAPEHAGR
jgi:hypothetical protein